VFDPFLDFQSAGYLRNVEGLKDPQRIKRLEHFFFESNLEEAVQFLSRQRGPVTYPHFLQVHRILFHEFYPWAGQDRQQLGVGRIVTKGPNFQRGRAKLSNGVCVTVMTKSACAEILEESWALLHGGTRSWTGTGAPCFWYMRSFVTEPASPSTGSSLVKAVISTPLRMSLRIHKTSFWTPISRG